MYFICLGRPFQSSLVCVVLGTFLSRIREGQRSCNEYKESPREAKLTAANSRRRGAAPRSPCSVKRGQCGGGIAHPCKNSSQLDRLVHQVSMPWVTSLNKATKQVALIEEDACKLVHYSVCIYAQIYNILTFVFWYGIGILNTTFRSMLEKLSLSNMCEAG